MNILSFWQNKAVIVFATGSTKYGNQYIIMNEFINRKFIVIFLIKDNIFSF